MVQFNKTEVGKRIKAARRKAGYSVSYVAERLELTRDITVYEWEKGRYLPSTEHLFALCMLYKVTMESILSSPGEDITDKNAA